MSLAVGRVIGVVVGVWLCLGPWLGAQTSTRLPDRLTDQEFWRLSTEMSEPNGFFRSENLVSNEHTFQYVIPDLARQVRPGGVYLGVAPDQNFTYIVATAPRMAFIVDVRRGNLLEHLLYKAIIELSPDRASFVSRLFSKPRPAGLRASATAAELMAAFDEVETREDAYGRNLQAVRNQLVRRHGFRLSPDDLSALEDIYFSFFWEGPGLQYTMATGLGNRGRFGFPTYQDLVTAGDAAGVARSYLSSEERYQALRSLQERNLIVPVVGNFAGPKALRAVGRYVREHGAAISAFYVSNVEQYLFQDGLFEAFARNVATLPIDERSTFIRSVSTRFGYDGAQRIGPDGRATSLYAIGRFLDDFRAGRLGSYFEVNRRGE